MLNTGNTGIAIHVYGFSLWQTQSYRRIITEKHPQVNHFFSYFSMELCKNAGQRSLRAAGEGRILYKGAQSYSDVDR